MQVVRSRELSASATTSQPFPDTTPTEKQLMECPWITMLLDKLESLLDQVKVAVVRKLFFIFIYPLFSHFKSTCWLVPSLQSWPQLHFQFLTACFKPTILNKMSTLFLRRYNKYSMGIFNLFPCMVAREFKGEGHGKIKIILVLNDN